MRKIIAFVITFYVAFALVACYNNPNADITTSPAAPTEDTAHGATHSPDDVSASLVMTVAPPSDIPKISGGGRYVSDGNYIYFANPEDGDALYRMSMDLDGSIKLDEMPCGDIYTDGEYVYFGSRIYNSPWHSICKIGIDGSGKTVLVHEGLLVGVSNGEIFYRDSAHQNLWKMNAAGTESSLVCEMRDVSYIVISDETIYFSDIGDSELHGIFSVQTDGTSLIKLNDDYAWWLRECDGNLYYGDDGLTALNPKTGVKTTLLEGDVNRLFVANGWAYYSEYRADAEGLWKIRTDGTDNTQLYSGAVYDICVVEDHIFFTVYVTSAEQYYYCISTDGDNLVEVGILS